MINLLDNVWLRIIALVLGLLIWLHVATNKNYTHELKLPITDISLADSLTLASHPPESVLVSLSATGKQLLRKKWRRLGLRLNAVGYLPGRYQVALSTSNLSLVDQPSQLSLNEVLVPQQLNLEIDQLATVRRPIVAGFVAVPDDGFAINHPVEFDPDSVTVTGPRSLIGRVGEIRTGPRQLPGLRDDVTLTLPLIDPELIGVSLDPDSVRVMLHVVPVKTRVFENIPISVFNVPTNLAIRVVPAVVRIELTGPPVEADQLRDGAITVSIDYNQASQSKPMPLKIDCPPAFKVKSSSADSAMIILLEDADTRN
ncbi:MAG: CdaR family protein [candidate division Zixibacteria bacterium]